jgi:hypothetical protein
MRDFAKLDHRQVRANAVKTGTYRNGAGKNGKAASFG